MAVGFVFRKSDHVIINVIENVLETGDDFIVGEKQTVRGINLEEGDFIVTDYEFSEDELEELRKPGAILPNGLVDLKEQFKKTTLTEQEIAELLMDLVVKESRIAELEQTQAELLLNLAMKGVV